MMEKEGTRYTEIHLSASGVLPCAMNRCGGFADLRLVGTVADPTPCRGGGRPYVGRAHFPTLRRAGHRARRKRRMPMSGSSYDVIILGTGPAGLQAAIHAVRTKVSVLVLGKQHKSSLYRAHIQNNCC
jgi:hypothetical protein